MLTIEFTDVYGFEAALRGMRNPKNSWAKSDSRWCKGCPDFTDCVVSPPGGSCPRDGDFSVDRFCIGEADHKLAMTLADAGTEHAKYLRMINVTADITGPLYWYKEFETYKVGTVANSCSTMHKIHEKEFTLADFSCEHLSEQSMFILGHTLGALNKYRSRYIESKDKHDWWQMIQLLPSSYNQRRTVQLNYAVLAGMYYQRRNHKLDEWQTFCNWIECLPYSELITGELVNDT